MGLIWRFSTITVPEIGEAEQKYRATYCSMEELLKQSDFVCLMTPLTPQTEKLIGKKEFELMKDTAIFINCSRGKTVDEEALIHALKRVKFMRRDWMSLLKNRLIWIIH